MRASVEAITFAVLGAREKLVVGSSFAGAASAW
jgi:hypothetical protein